MRAASLKEIKTELDIQPQHVLLGLCLRLAKFKKENKELLTYLLFEESNEAAYVESVKREIDNAFLELNTKSLYIAKKNLRKTLRMINRYIKYSAEKTTEVGLLIYFCSKVKASGLNIDKSAALVNLVASQIKKINAGLADLHEDLQYDLKKEMKLIL